MISSLTHQASLSEITAASLTFHMPAMGSMPEMKDGATLTTTDTPGKFRAKTKFNGRNLGRTDQIQDPKGPGHTSMTVNAMIESARETEFSRTLPCLPQISLCSR